MKLPVYTVRNLSSSQITRNKGTDLLAAQKHNLAWQLYQVASRDPMRLAIISKDVTVTYGQLMALVLGFAKKMKREGVGKGSISALDSDDVVTMTAFMFATAYLGSAWVRAEKQLQQTKVVTPTHFFRSEDRTGVSGKEFIVIDRTWSVQNTRPVVSESEIEKAVTPDDYWLYTHTSGTMGTPKFVGLSQKTVSLRSTASRTDFLGRETRFASLFEHTARPLISRLIALLLAGSTFVASRNTEFWKRSGVNLVMGSPNQVLEYLVGKKLLPKIPILHVGGGKLKDSVALKLLDSFEQVIDLYGSTETNRSYRNVKSLDAGGTVRTKGEPLDSIVEIVNTAGEKCQPGNIGSVRISNPYLAEGYLNNVEAQQRCFKDGWFYPGDLASWGVRGELVIHGREDDVFNFGGVKVSAVLVDSVIKSTPGVRDAIAFLNPRADRRDELLVFFVLSDDVSVAGTIETAKILCRTNLGHLFVPKKFFPVNELPQAAKGISERKHCELVVADYLLTREQRKKDM